MILNLIECDVLYDDLQADYVSYGTMFERFFTNIAKSESDKPFAVKYYSAIEQLLPTPQAGHVYLITGSKFGAYEEAEWIHSLIKWIQQTYQANARLIGICFGHQIIAQALGGQVINSKKGWGVGVRELPVKALPPVFEADSNSHSFPDTLKFIYSHQDQVVELPSSAQTMLGDDFCPNAGFFIGNQVITFQGHPEFDSEYIQRLLGRRVDHIGRETFDLAMSSLSQQTDNPFIGSALLDWIDTKS